MRRLGSHRARGLPFLCGLLIIGLTPAAPAYSAMTLAVTPAQLARDADQIFAGTVVQLHAERDGGHTVTLVTFSGLHFAKGNAPSDRLTLTLLGGATGGEAGVVDGQPQFATGKRYIVFSDRDRGSDRNHFMPVVALEQGQFQVMAPAPGAESIVCDWQGRPVVKVSPKNFTLVLPDSLLPPRAAADLAAARARRIKHGHRFVLDEGGTRETLLGEDDPGTRLSEEEFLDTIAGLSSL